MPTPVEAECHVPSSVVVGAEIGSSLHNEGCEHLRFWVCWVTVGVGVRVGSKGRCVT